MLRTLAAAYAETGRYGEAVEVFGAWSREPGAKDGGLAFFADDGAEIDGGIPVSAHRCHGGGPGEELLSFGFGR